MKTPETTQPWAGVPATGPLMRPDDAAQYLGISTAQFYAMAASGELPRPIKIGARALSRASGVPRPWLDAIISSRAAA